MTKYLTDIMLLALSWLLIIIAGIAITFGISISQSQPAIIAILCFCLALILQGVLFHRYRKGVRGMKMALLNLKDGEYGSTISPMPESHWQSLHRLINGAIMAMQQQKRRMYHRELLFNRVLDSSPIITLLTDQQQQVVYANTAANNYFSPTDNIMSYSLPELMAQQDSVFSNAFMSLSEQVFEFQNQQQERQIWHVSCHQLTLNEQPHHLFLLRSLADSFNRREVSALKRAIRVLNHELNNSLAPLSSLCHSGEHFAVQLKHPQLQKIFDTFNGRIQRLNHFIQQYSRFARLPPPQQQALDWYQLLQQMKQLTGVNFHIEGTLHVSNGDSAQLEQLLLNLIKNAQQSGSQLEDIEVLLTSNINTGSPTQYALQLAVKDRGCGLSPEALEHALLPFYTTKADGTGVGLTLCREIAQAHGGSLSIRNRTAGGVCVTVQLPSNSIAD